MRTWFLAVLFFSSVHVAYSQTPRSITSEERRCRKPKFHQTDRRIADYSKAAKQLVERAWHSSGTPNFTTSKIRVSLDRLGNLADCKLLSDTIPSDADKTIVKFIRTQKFSPLPEGLNSLDLDWIVQSDGRTILIHLPNSPEAIKHNSNSLCYGAFPASVVTTSEKSAYLTELRSRILRAWYPPKCDGSGTTTLRFKISSQGELSDLKLVKSSAVSSAEQAALRAVRNAAPFRPLSPAPEMQKPYADIQFTFGYKNSVVVFLN